MHTSKFFSVSLLVICTALLAVGYSGAVSSGVQKTYELKYQLPVGTKFIMTSMGATEIVTDQMGTEVAVDIQSEGKDIYVVTGEQGNGLSIEVEMGERTQDVSSMMGSDSTDYSELVGKKVKFVLLPNGEVEGYAGFEDLPEITTATGEKLTEELYRLGVEETFPKLPEKSVKLGDTWSDTEDREMPLEQGSLLTASDFTYRVLEEITRDGIECLKIEVAGTTKLSGEFEQQGNSLSMEREVKSSGFLYFAHQQGMFIGMEMDSRAEGVITVLNAGIDLPQTITSKGTVTVRFE